MSKHTWTNSSHSLIPSYTHVYYTNKSSAKKTTHFNDVSKGMTEGIVSNLQSSIHATSMTHHIYRHLVLSLHKVNSRSHPTVLTPAVSVPTRRRRVTDGVRYTTTASKGWTTLARYAHGQDWTPAAHCIQIQCIAIVNLILHLNFYYSFFFSVSGVWTQADTPHLVKDT